jgi:hypothetical protein
MSVPGMDTILKWILHPGTYEMVWYVLMCVVWYGFSIERRLKIIQDQLDAKAADEAKEPPVQS